MKYFQKKGGEKMQDKQEELLRKKIKQIDIIPNTVNKKIEQAIQSLEIEERKCITMKWKKLVPLVASIALILFLGGNGIAYATGNPNIFSFLLSKFNISEEYEKEAKKIGITQNNNGVEMTITDIAIDQNLLIIGYKIKGEKIQNSPFFLEGEKTIKVEGKEKIKLNYYSSGERRNKQQIEQLSSGEYMVYEIYHLDNVEENKKLSLSIQLNAIQLYTPNQYNVVYGEKITGEWNFEIPVEIENKQEAKEYQPKDAKFYITNKEYIQINSIRVTKIGTLLNVTSNCDTIMSLQIINKAGESLLNKNTQEIMSGDNTILMKKIKEQEELNIQIYKYGTEQEVKNGKLALQQESPKQQEKITYKKEKIGNMTLQIPENWEVNKEQKDKLMFLLYEIYQNGSKEFDSYVSVEKKDNATNSSLEAIKEEVVLAKEIAYDIKENNYFYYDNLLKHYVIIDKKDYDKETANKFMITKQEIYDILKKNKENIVKGNVKIGREELQDILQPGFQVKEEEKIKIQGQDAYELTIKTNAGTEKVIIIKQTKQWYEVTYNIMSKEKEEIEKMIQNIKFE